MYDEKNLTVKEAFNLAVQNHQEGKTDIAQELYNNVLKIDPNHSQALNNIAVIFTNSKDYQKAISSYEKAIEINPDYADAHNNLGIIFQELSESQKAKRCYEKAIELNPNHQISLYNLGVIFQELGEHQKSKSCYEKAIEIIPNYADAHNNLGNIFKDLGEHQKAKSCYEKAIEIIPNYADAHNNLGNIFEDLGEHQKAKSCYEKAIEIDPNNISSINALSFLLELHRFNYKSEDDKTNFKKLIISLFKKSNIETSFLFKNAKLILFSDEEQNQLEDAINSDSFLSNKILQRLLKEELFHLLIQKSILTDIFLEKLLTRLRYEILFNLENFDKDNLEDYFNFIISLAEQCWLNEYLYVQSVKEINLVNKLKQKIENNEEINELQISILGCYTPLNSSKNIIDKLLNYKSSNLLFNDLISLQIKEPLKENELVKSIQSLEEIVDPVSKKVQEQYEENPYPRWRCTQKILSKNFFYWFNEEINPNKIEYNDKFNNPNVLIAGCGTGSHPISSTRYKNSNILAVDLSLTSLAYAKRKTEEFGYKNIEYMQADILQLKKLNKKFDIIESIGTLHHMKEPIVGFKVLVDLLEPHGFLRLGLYSDTARKVIVEAREYIKEHNLKNTGEDIKICRQLIFNEKGNPLLKRLTTHSPDFYTISSVRDLLFHVQEHRFTIPQISKILKDLNLEFLGFFFSDPLVKKKFSESFPEDKKNTSLDNWHQFEINNPDTFGRMYQFWIRKI